MKKHIPNILTCCNLTSGCLAAYFAFQNDFLMALVYIITGATFDFFDGFAARLLHVSSPIGKELDSLADDITFGFAPSVIVFSALRMLVSPEYCAADCPLNNFLLTPYIPFVAFLIASFSALRLAKFNLDERQTSSFIGLPTPANALFWASLCLSLYESKWLEGEPWLIFVLIPGILLSCWLLVAEIPMFALKFKNFSVKDNALRYGFILCSIVLLTGLGWIGFAAVIVLYVLTSLAQNIIGTKIADTE